MPNRKIDTEAPAFGARLMDLLAANHVPRRGAGAYLQRKYGVSNVTANDWLNGKFRPEIETARRIAVDHGSGFDELYFGKPSSAHTGKADDRSTDLKIARLENDVHVLNIVLGTLVATMVDHRPAEAQDAAAALKKATPAKYLEGDLIQGLIEVLEHAKSARKRAG
jgi:hypothetical protein